MGTANIDLDLTAWRILQIKFLQEKWIAGFNQLNFVDSQRCTAIRPNRIDTQKP